MKAVILDEVGTIRIAEVDRRAPGPGEVTVRVSHTGICGTDLHAEELSFFTRGVVLGHEFTGTVAEVGAGVGDWSVGDRVVVNPNGAVCGTCEACRAGARNLCAELRKIGVGVNVDGGLAEYVTLSAATLHRLPAAISLRDGVWVEPVAVAVRGVNVSAVQAGDPVVVYGAGPVGLALVAVLRSRGVDDVAVVEPSAFRRDVAARAGARVVMAPREYDDAVRDGTVPRPARAYDCVGHPDVIELALRALRPQGVLTVVGQSPTPPRFDADDLVGKELTIRGSFIYVEEFTQAIELLASGRLDVGPWTTSVHPIEEAMDAFEALRDPQASVKSVIQLS